MSGGGLLPFFSLGGLTFLLLSLHESLLLPFSRHHHLLLRRLLLLPLSLLSTFLPLLFLSSSPLLLSLSSLSSLFLLSSLPFPLPSPLHHLLLLSSFLLELLFLVLLPRKDPLGVENQYYTLLCVPSLLCSLTTLLCHLLPRSPHPPLARSLSLALHGSWLLQMAFSLFSSAASRGCHLLYRGAGDFTVLCGGHGEYHRAKAIATLQFNCHLAALVVAAVGIYWLVGSRGSREGRQYVALTETATVRGLQPPTSRYVLVSEDEDEVEEAVDDGQTGAAVAVAALEVEVEGGKGSSGSV